ncbi:MAG: hypothetical protein IKX44_09785 [Prevotella sp.]|nr:hypothetical protein [Prevotella sp.]
MRKLLTIILIAVCTTTLAQEKRIYFYSDFVKSNILYKNGARNQTNANYDVANRKLMFMQGEQLMELLAPETIDTLYMGGSRWVYRDKQFCEVIDREDGNRILVGWHVTKVHEGYVGALGSVAQAPSRKVQLGDQFGMGTIAGISGGMYNGTFGTNQNDGNGRNFDVWKTKNKSTYYFTKNGKGYAVKGMKSILKAFPQKKELIKQFVHNKKIDTMTAEGMLQVIDYILTL